LGKIQVTGLHAVGIDFLEDWIRDQDHSDGAVRHEAGAVFNVQADLDYFALTGNEFLTWIE
jgi:hypothetical protein